MDGNGSGDWTLVTNSLDRQNPILQKFVVLEGMLRLRAEDRLALLVPSLSMTTQRLFQDAVV